MAKKFRVILETDRVFGGGQAYIAECSQVWTAVVKKDVRGGYGLTIKKGQQVHGVTP